MIKNMKKELIDIAEMEIEKEIIKLFLEKLELLTKEERKEILVVIALINKVIFETN